MFTNSSKYCVIISKYRNVQTVYPIDRFSRRMICSKEELRMNIMIMKSFTFTLKRWVHVERVHAKEGEGSTLRRGEGCTPRRGEGCTLGEGGVHAKEGGGVHVKEGEGCTLRRGRDAR